MTLSSENRKQYHIFISPHFDDVVLSCGGMIASFAGKESVLVVTIFTGAGEGKLSRYGKKYIQFCGFKNSRQYFKTRKKEEKKAATILKYETKWLGFPEALFRYKERPVFPRFFYNNKKKLLGKINKDEEILPALEKKVKNIINSYHQKIKKVYFPLGVGGHVDHRLLNQIGQGVVRRSQLKKEKVYFYEDFPYLLTVNRKEMIDSFQKKKMKRVKIYLNKKSLKLKQQSILVYSSQIKPLFKTEKNFEKQFIKFYQEPYENYWHFV